MRKCLVAGNWKMNGTLESIGPLLDGIKNGIRDLDDVEVAVCPPYVYLNSVADQIKGTPILLGGQNMSQEKSGAFTGEISGVMLQDFGCNYVILGHSERRSLYAEDSKLVAEKFVQAQALGLIPILCVGESLEERETGRTEVVIEKQIRAVLERDGAAGFAKAVIAYEPVWAIGTGLTATPEQAQSIHAYIRDLVAEYEPDRNIAEQVQILYGGSVKPDNAEKLFGMQDIDGGLIGGAALNAEDFLAICRAAVA